MHKQSLESKVVRLLCFLGTLNKCEVASKTTMFCTEVSWNKETERHGNQATTFFIYPIKKWGEYDNIMRDAKIKLDVIFGE